MKSVLCSQFLVLKSFKKFKCSSVAAQIAELVLCCIFIVDQATQIGRGLWMMCGAVDEKKLSLNEL